VVYVEWNSSLIFLVFVVPLAIYCLVLSAINRKRHPVIVSGSWDFAGVLFAASGILLVGGPAILTGLYEHWRLSWLLGQTRYLQGIGENWSFWISLWLVYFAVVAGGSALLLWRRRRRTSIYNVEPLVFEETLIQVLDRLGLEWVRQGPRRVLVRFREPLPEGGSGAVHSILFQRHSTVPSSSFQANAALSRPQPAVTPPPASAYPWTEIGLEAFPAMRHMTLCWPNTDEAIRQEVETELAEALVLLPTRPSSISAWFLSLALGLFFSAFFVLCALLVMRILRMPR
jgi:hypothetical protein